MRNLQRIIGLMVLTVVATVMTGCGAGHSVTIADYLSARGITSNGVYELVPVDDNSPELIVQSADGKFVTIAFNVFDPMNATNTKVTLRAAVGYVNNVVAPAGSKPKATIHLWVGTESVLYTTAENQPKLWDTNGKGPEASATYLFEGDLSALAQKHIVTIDISRPNS